MERRHIRIPLTRPPVRGDTPHPTSHHHEPEIPTAGEPREHATPCLALRPREAAWALGISERTLWEWTQRQEVPHVRRGKTVRYPVDALRRWLDEQAGAARQEAEVSSGQHRH